MLTKTTSQAPAAYKVDDYGFIIRYQWPTGGTREEGCFTAQVEEMPGVIVGGLTAEAALSEVRAVLAEVIAWYAEEVRPLPVPGSRPPYRYAKKTPLRIDKSKRRKKARCASLSS